MHASNHASHRNPLHCILPPYMLEEIAKNGTPDMQAQAAATLATTKMMINQRAAAARGEFPAGAAAPKAASPGKHRYVYTANHGTSLPGTLVRSEGDPACGDVAIDEAYEGAGATYDLYWEAYQRASIDNANMVLNSTAHYSNNYDNAFWNGLQMVYGDGDGQLFNRFTIAIDVMGHELTHGVTQYEANLSYSNQPGALNESMSDVFGSLVKQRSLGQDARSADWIIGAGLFTANVNGVGIRSMKAPGTAYDDLVLGKDPQPDHMSKYVNTVSDNGGVHINSGIPNKAFYLTAYELGGNAWEKAGRIWYVTLSDRLNSTSKFQDAAELTYAVAGELYGANSLEQTAVKNGWAGVGITVGSSSNPGCLASLISVFRPNVSARK
jgi:Zn-dependent metalloprotease